MNKKLICLGMGVLMMLGGAGCTLEEPSKPEVIEKVEKKTEPIKQNIEEKDNEETKYTYIKDMSDLDKDYIPQVYNGYFVAKTNRNSIKIYDEDGNEATTNTYEQVIYNKDSELFFIDSNGYTESFGYAVGKEPSNEVKGFSESTNNVIAYNTESKDVVETDFSNSDYEWRKAKADQRKQGTYIIHSVDDVEQNNTNGKEYYWNTYTNQVYDAQTQFKQDWLEYYTPNKFVSFTEGMYAVNTGKNKLWQIVDKDKITEKEYSKAVSVSKSAVFGINGKTCILSKSLDNVIILPETAQLATDTNNNSILVLEDSVWKLYATDKTDKQE